MTVALCSCVGPNTDCRRAGQPMVGRLWELCAGKQCTPEVSEAYRRLWDSVSRSQRGSCVYLGGATGQLRSCASCRGRVELKVFACTHPAHAADPTTTALQCRSCPDFQGQEKQA